jgi:hypothetical protein
MTRVMRAILLLPLLAAVAPAADAQQVVRFDRVRAAPSLPSVAVAVQASPSPGRLYAGSAAGAALGSAAGWVLGVGTVVLFADRNSDWNDAWNTVIGAALVGMAGSVVLGGAGSQMGVRAAGGQGGSLLKHVGASALGFMGSMVVANAIFSGSNEPGGLEVLGAVALTHGLVTGVFAPRH